MGTVVLVPFWGSVHPQLCFRQGGLVQQAVSPIADLIQNEDKYGFIGAGKRDGAYSSLGVALRWIK